ncbi:MAG: leucyl aminopeptidase [Granulosicoccus sp.]
MQIRILSRIPATTENSCQLLTLFADGKLKGAARKIDQDSEGLIKKLFANGDFNAEKDQTLVLHDVKGAQSGRILLVGLGDRKTANGQTWRSACDAAAKALLATPATIAISDCLVSTTIDSLSEQDMAKQLTQAIVANAYNFTLHPKKKQTNAPQLETLALTTERKKIDAVSVATHRGLAIGNGMAAARDLGNLAPNICTPAYLAKTAQDLDDRFPMLSTQILDETDMEELGMGAFLAVSQGSRQPGKMIVMNYQGRKRAGSPIVFVGKGVTFDTGGISIKSSDGMDEMKYDMCGAASVYGTMQAIAELELDVNAIGLVAAAENMPDGDAARPGDVVTTMSGQSVEILNTDAEGRLVLCDALTYAERFKPAAVIDMATLTGACVVALGNVTSAVFGNHQGTIDELLAAGQQSGDRTWQLPLWDEYQSQLDSNFADIANIGGRAAGAITAACFLSRFAGAYHWAHLDIAGIAWKSGKEKGATGRPVPLLMQYVFNRLKG